MSKNISNQIIKHKKWVSVGVILFIVLVVIVGMVIYNSKGVKASQSPDVNYDVTEKNDSIDAWGEVKYTKVYDISIDFLSVVSGISVKEGDHVSLGDTLVTMDMTEYQQNIEKLQQQLSTNQTVMNSVTQDTAALEAEILQMQKDISTKSKELSDGTYSDLKLLQNSLTLVKKEVITAQNNLKDNQLLYAGGAISKYVLDQYQDALDQKVKAQTDIEDNISKTKRALQDELDQLNVSLKSKQVQLTSMHTSNTSNQTKQGNSITVSQLDLDIMKDKGAKDYIIGNKIVSNVKNGIVQNISVINNSRLGVQGTPTPVLQLIDADSITISAEVQEEFISKVTIGETVKIVPTSDKSTSITGTVTQIPSVAVEKDGKRIIKVEVKPQDPNKILKPGYTADVYFSTK